MATSLLTPNTSPDTDDTGISEASVEFPDNLLLIELCGEYDRNLAYLEQQLGTQILRRGNHLVAHGEAPAPQQTVGVLRALYARLEADREVTQADIDRELRMGEPGADSTVSPTEGGDQLEMFRGGEVEIKTRRKMVEPRTAAQKEYVQNLYKHELAFGIGPAGTGKTYLAVAVAVNHFIEGHVDKIILTRPAVEAGERLGFLPGTQEEKVDPYMQPLYDALNDFLGAKDVGKLREARKIEIAPLAFMRGRTLANAFVVLDEAQNATTMQMKMFLTRLGENSRMVITGDRSQVDLPRGVQSGLRDAERLLGAIPDISFNYFTAKDVVRHPLVAKIIEAYEADEES
ncbi:PhoH family protein [Pseudooceanicola marinus]|uniref:PhoH family protein n=1 Tax=Pseudooceanicola marinus TaxID=396013 RepID=UPI003990C23E